MCANETACIATRTSCPIVRLCQAPVYVHWRRQNPDIDTTLAGNQPMSFLEAHVVAAAVAVVLLPLLLEFCVASLRLAELL